MGNSNLKAKKLESEIIEAVSSQVLQLPMRIAKMKTFTVAAAVLASLVSESFGAECSGPGALCAYQSSGAEVCSPCPAGYSCRPWVSTSGNPGNGKCQSDYCLGPGDVCSGTVGTCCAGYTCVGDGCVGDRYCTLQAKPKRFKVCELGKKCQAANHSFSKCRGCPDGSSCRVWIKSDGSYGHGFCQLDECIPAGGDCTGRKGVCCAAHSCVDNTCTSNGGDLAPESTVLGEDLETGSTAIVGDLAPESI